MIAPSENRAIDRQRLRSVDALRGIAALAVLFTHVPHLESLPTCGRRLLFLPLDFGRLGVTLFLVISGFCIHLTVAKKLAGGQGIACNWASFWRRRFHRLYPPYLAAIVVGLLCVLAYCWLHPLYRGDWENRTSFAWDLGTHLLLIHNLFNKYILALGNGAFWSLGLEEQLYALYAIFLLFRARFGLSRAFQGVLALSLSWYAIGVASTGSFNLLPATWGFWPLNWWAVWLLGALAAENYAGVISLPHWCYCRRVAFVLACAGVLLFQSVFPLLHVEALFSLLFGENHASRWLLENYRVLTYLSSFAFSLTFFIMLNRVVRAECNDAWRGRANHWLARIGIISYSLYLVHLPILRVCEGMFWQLHLGRTIVGTLVRYVIGVPVCLAAAFGFFNLVESRFLNPKSGRRVQPPMQFEIKKAA